MKFKKPMMRTLIIVFILIQGKNAYAVSSNNSSVDLENITPGYSQEEIQSSSDRVNSFTNTFTGSSFGIAEKTDSKKKTESINKNEVASQQIMPENVIITSQQSTGKQGDFWGRTADGKWILIENNVPATGWKIVKNKWYYMNFDGVMQTGWLKDNGIWYYLKSNGEMAVNTIIDGYRINGSGVLI